MGEGSVSLVRGFGIEANSYLDHETVRVFNDLANIS